MSRVYEKEGKRKGSVFLVDRLWPRGLRKEALDAAWIRDAAPSRELRQWFRHGPEKWEEFRERYFKELESNPSGWESLLEAAGRGDVTLLYAAADPEHNNAAALKIFLEGKLAKR